MGLTAYQAHMKRELKGKMKGKTAAQRKAIFKAAAKSYKKKGVKPRAKASKSKAKPRAKASKSTGGRSTMGKKGGFNTQKIFKFVRLGALAIPAATTLMGPGTVAQKTVVLKRDYFGIGADGKFALNNLAKGWLPFIAASAITYGIPKLTGIIRSF